MGLFLGKKSAIRSKITLYDEALALSFKINLRMPLLNVPRNVSVHPSSFVRGYTSRDICAKHFEVLFEQSALILFNSLHSFVSSHPASFTTVYIIMYSFYSQCSLCCYSSSLSFILKKRTLVLNLKILIFITITYAGSLWDLVSWNSFGRMKILTGGTVSVLSL